jgi:hypothetical protein
VIGSVINPHDLEHQPPDDEFAHQAHSPLADRTAAALNRLADDGTS